MAKTEMRLAKVLKDMHRGAVQDEIDTKFSELIAAVREQGRKGTLTLTVEVVPQGGNQHNVMATVASKVPKPKARPALFYSTDDNNLQREDPEQQEMFSDAPADNITKMPPASAASTPPPAQAAV